KFYVTNNSYPTCSLSSQELNNNYLRENHSQRIFPDSKAIAMLTANFKSCGHVNFLSALSDCSGMSEMSVPIKLQY
ncbi:2843_t:CDS:1, partial [Funneliformis caledonium]